jgi:hypothetical protein
MPTSWQVSLRVLLPRGTCQFSACFLQYPAENERLGLRNKGERGQMVFMQK